MGNIKSKFILTCPICLATTLKESALYLKLTHGNNFDQYMTDDITSHSVYLNICLYQYILFSFC